MAKNSLLFFWIFLISINVECLFLPKKLANQNIDPCDNFYEFACEEFIHKYPIKNETEFEFNSSNNESSLLIETCFIEAINPTLPSKSEAVKKLHQFQRTFMNIEDLNKLGTKDLIREIEDFGACSLLSGNQWKEKDFNLTNMLLKMGKLSGNFYLLKLELMRVGIDSDLGLGVVPTDFNLKILSKFVNESGVMDRSIFGTIVRYSTDVLNLIANDMGTQVNLSQIIEVVEMEVALIKLYNDNGHFLPVNDSVGLYEIKLSDFMEMFTSLNSSSSFFIESAQTPFQLHQYISSNPIIYIQNPALLYNLNQFYLSIRPRILANYFCVHYVLNQHNDLDERFRVIGNAILQKNSQMPDLSKRFLEGLKLIQTNFPRITDHLFVTKCVDDKTENLTREMMNNIQISIKEMLLDQNWLDPISRESALHKLNKLKKMIGALDISHNITLLDNYYKDLDFSANDTLRDLNRKIAIFNDHKKLLYILHPSNFTRAASYLSTTKDSIHIYAENLIYILAGMLYPPYFDPKRPMSINYGALGTIIGHEMMHLFDTKGIAHDEHGNSRNWMQTETQQKFNEKAACFIEQYSQQMINKLGIYSNGLRTLEENLSDNGGLIAAYRAYKRNLSINSIEFENYLDDQNFFIGFAKQWCYNGSRAAHLYYALVDEHSMQDIRVNTALSNLDEFSDAFKCKKGSKMNPLEKCKVW